mmetsp:Transcript_28055/g.57468  ORF Transcript_28055/g.57468 Transcript_28055/m.57468 type:complete len:245 (+) Transcript_28055:2455-3189(+)
MIVASPTALIAVMVLGAVRTKTAIQLARLRARAALGPPATSATAWIARPRPASAPTAIAAVTLALALASTAVSVLRAISAMVMTALPTILARETSAALALDAPRTTVAILRVLVPRIAASEQTATSAMATALRPLASVQNVLAPGFRASAPMNRRHAALAPVARIATELTAPQTLERSALVKTVAMVPVAIATALAPTIPTNWTAVSALDVLNVWGRAALRLALAPGPMASSPSTPFWLARENS